MLDAGKITVKIEAFLGPNCSIYATTHPIEADKRMQFAIGRAVVIDEFAWLGGNVVVLPGVHIGKHSIIGAGSVVTRNVPDHEMWAGNPARFIKKC
jgi:acetyltransferase-like isoleucine patch superfamily enzyme